MTSLLRSASQYWHYVVNESSDERTKGWFLAGSPLIPLFLMFAYYQIVKKIGPAFMKDRKPFEIDRLIQVYNVVQVILNGWLTYKTFSLTFGANGNYSWTCQPLDHSKSPDSYKVPEYAWIYYMIKIIDLLDTVFFVLRKKFNQVSFLHVYHHLGVIVLGYIATKYYPDGHGSLLVTLNSFVHCFMYTYYFLSNYNSNFKKNIWWKKYITQIQLIQFLILEYHFGKVLFMPSCTYPRLAIWLYLPQNTFMLYLFSKFYKNTYLTPEKPIKSS